MKIKEYLNGIIGGFIGCLFCLAVFGTTFSYTYDKTTPAGTDAPSVLDDRDREIKLAVQERENVDHYWPYASQADVAGGNEVASQYTGEHRKITFYGNITDPTQVTGKSHLYQKSGELYFQDATNTTLQMTSGGDLNSSAGLSVTSNATVGGTLSVTGDSTFSGTLGITGAATLSGGGTLGAALAAGSNKITGLASATSSGDAIHYGQFTDITGWNTWSSGTSANYSYTLPGGLIWHFGFKHTFTGGTIAIDISGAGFSKVFMAGAWSYETGSDSQYDMVIDGLSTTSLAVDSTNSSIDGVFYLVIGS